MTENSEKSKRIIWLDIAKGIGIILVVIGHCNPPDWLKTFIFAFHMPLFFFLAGFVYRAPSENDYVHRLKKDFSRLLIPYFLTVAVVGIFLLIIQSQGRKGYYESLEALGISALFGSGSGYNGIKLIGEIWFLLAMFWARRVMDVVFLFKNQTIRFLAFCALAFVSISLASSKKWIPSNIDIAFIAAWFMYIGYLVGQKTEIIGSKIVIMLALMISVVSLSSSSFGMSSRNYYNMWFATLPGAIGLIVLVCNISRKIESVKGISSFLSYVGKHSLLFMCIHSIDWRMPFPKFGQSFISRFSSNSWYWCISSLHRFLFDLLIMIAILLTARTIKLVIKRCRYLNH